MVPVQAKSSNAIVVQQPRPSPAESDGRGNGQHLVIKQLGINLSGSTGFGSAVVNFNTINPFPVNGTPSSSVSGGFKGLTATLQAMEQVGVVRTLAEPTLTAISG